MAPEDLRRLLRTRPFVPFRLFLAGGHHYDVVGPEWMMVTGTTSALGTPGKSGDGELVALLDNMSITHTEPLSYSSPPPVVPAAG